MKKALTFIAFGLLTSGVWANPSLTQDFRSLLTRYKVGALANQSYCYQNSNGDIGGYQISKLMPIASVTKLFTTYFASELLDLNKRYTTKIHIKGNALHIEGGNDPYFEEEKMLLLMKALNERGYASFKTVTFDKNFKFSDVALGEYQVLTQTHIRGKIATYFNSDTNRSYLINKWKTISKFAEEEGIFLDKETNPQMVVSSVLFSDKNPLEGTQEVTLIHKSKPLHQLLKAMNVMSKNLVSHYVFDEASQVQGFGAFMKSRGFDISKITFYNGSGLPVKNGNTRRDNLTNCTTVLSLVQRLHESLRRKGFEPSDIIAVNGGKDNGSFRDRFEDFPETHEAVLSKTGTLAVSSTLAGTLETLNGEVQFSILNKPNSSLAARNFQDHFVSRMFHHLGEAAPIPYEKISIFPWDGLQFFDN
jgi:D-alanyl-D-alanine carboxypeptidase/D-alanyl-D-alanine-endopeptidase (penicillin-binding protein 4)